MLTKVNLAKALVPFYIGAVEAARVGEVSCAAMQMCEKRTDGLA
jgi:hypothetical protein